MNLAHLPLLSSRCPHLEVLDPFTATLLRQSALHTSLSRDPLMSTNKHRRRPIGRGRRWPGWTLAEIVVSAGIMSILMVGLGSAILVASKAVPTRDDPTARASDTAIALQEMAADLTAATGFSTYTARAVTFTVADRDNDGNPETISYAWSGTPGDPLTRRVNSGKAVEVAAGVADLGFAYDMHSWTETFDPADTESGETLLSGHSLANSSADFAITSSDSAGQYFAPALPVDTISWKITRARLRMRSRGALDGVAAVQIRPALGDGTPQSTVLDEQLVAESSLTSSYAWQNLSFTKLTSLAPGTALCLTVVTNVNDADVCELNYDNAGGQDGLARMGGEDESWFRSSSRSLLYEIYGTVTTRSTPDPITHSYMLRVHVKLETADRPGAPMQTSVSILNVPEL